MPVKFIDFPQEVHPERLVCVEELGNYKNKVILDMGAGNHLTVPEAIGLDIRPVSDIHCSVDSVPFKDNYADFIIARHVLEHMIDPIKTLFEWKRLLKIGGKMIILLPDHLKMNTMHETIGGGDYPHLHVYTQESFRSLISLFKEFKIEKLKQVIEDWSFVCVIKLLSK